MKINLLDLFSGIGGFSLGLQRAGFEIENHLFSEIDNHAIAIYKNQFPEANYVGSVTDVRGAGLPRANAITFGSPCQDFSLAGKRTGMGGERSSLITEAIRLITECRPDFFIWENVKGTFSSNAGEDFWAIIQAFTNIGGYRLEWQLLNTAWFLPQNRERIYLVGRLADKCTREIFPLKESEVRNFKQGHQHRQAINPKQTEKSTWAMTGFGQYNEATKSSTLKARDYKDAVDLIVEGNRVRGLTALERERVQGFPDHWTKYGNYNGKVKKVSRKERCKCTGNAASVDVVEAVGKAILGAANA